MLLKKTLETKDEINTSQVTKNSSVANLEVVCNEKKEFLQKDLTLTAIYS